MVTKVLVVEDDQLLKKELLRVLGENDITAVWAKSVQEAKALLEAEPVALALLDVMLGETESGLDILMHIKQSDKLKKIPVIMLTNNGPIDAINRAMELGATDYIVKVNTDLKTVVEIVRKHL